MRRFAEKIIVLSVVLLLPGRLAATALSSEKSRASISGELQQWHKVTLTLDGPEASETGSPNPFLDYRLQVTFRHAASGLTYVVPGYFAADGNAANTSATSGNKWRAHLSPDHQGEWSYEVAFHTGTNIAVSEDSKAGKAIEGVDGYRGVFRISASDKRGRDFRGKGRLQYVKRHHLQFSGTREDFLKAGVDAPENFLSYRDFDGNFKSDGHKDQLVKNWSPHIRDWKTGDPVWQDSKGKGMIGAINYLSSQGLNSFSFLTMNIEGDDRNVFPYTEYDERERIDCSRMDQWEIVFAHGTQNGMYLHFKTQEAENVNLLDDGHTGTQRKLYYRELIARFAHHLALNWNLGEEVGLGHKVSTEKKLAWANYFRSHDPYHHHIVIHNGNRHYDLMGPDSPLTGFSLQTNRPDFRNVHGSTLNYIQRSAKAGKPWVVACDEPGDASHSLVTDTENPKHDNARRNALWGNLMAGGAGVEWYFGYAHPHSDLTCQDYRVRRNMWKQCRIALDFFSSHRIPFGEMTNANHRLSGKDDYCLYEPEELYLVYLKPGSASTVDLSDESGVWEVKWFDPREGGALQIGSTEAVMAGKQISIGNPPDTQNEDWLALIRPGDPQRNYAPATSCPSSISAMLPGSGTGVAVTLAGRATDDHTSDSALVVNWRKISGPGTVTFETPQQPQTTATFLSSGEYLLQLSASDGNETSIATTWVRISPFQNLVTQVVAPSDDVYTEDGGAVRNDFLKIEGKRRITYLRFNVGDLPGKVTSAGLRFQVNGDSGSGKLRIYRGSRTNWTDTTLTTANTPRPEELLAEQDVSPGRSDVISIPVTSMLDRIDKGEHTFIVTLDQGGNDIWFGSSRSQNGPALEITFDNSRGSAEEEEPTAPQES